MGTHGSRAGRRARLALALRGTNGEVVEPDIDEEHGVLRLEPDQAAAHEVCVRWGAEAGEC